MRIQKYILITAVIVLFANNATAQTTSTGNVTSIVSPKLVVNIVVSSLRDDFFVRFGEKLSDKGIKMMLKQGAVCKNANYNYLNTNTVAGISTIMTGANPDSHGIISDRWRDFTTNQEVRIEVDKRFNGLGSDDENNGRVSPQNLIVSSIGDQLKSYNSLSHVVSVAINPWSSMVAAGRQADVAYWFDMHKGNWLTSTYYKNKTPEWLLKYNKQRYVDVFAGTVWNLSRKSSEYISKDRGKEVKSDMFMTFGGHVKEKNYAETVATPSGSDMIFEFSKQAMIYEDLGRDDIPDMITICVEPFGEIGKKYGSASVEIEDALYCLDKNISELLQFLDAQFGMNNVLVVLTSDHGCSNTVKDDPKSAAGKFNVMQFKAIIGGFLNAQLGVGEWVSDYHDGQLYLNRAAIYDKGLKLAEVQEMVSGFAIQFKGVSNVLTSTALQNTSFNKGIPEKMQNSFFPRRSGDLTINLLPGWIDDYKGVVSSSGSAYRYDTHVPIVWYGAKIPAGVVYREVDMRDIAPTLSRILQVPIPEAASGKAIDEIIKNRYDN